MRKLFKIIIIFISVFYFLGVSPLKAHALEIETLSVRSRFYTSFNTSSSERIWNIKLAAKALDKTLIEPNQEFSFNERVGERTEKRGYKKATIISFGEFSEGVGGGVCQVSTTLFNAFLTAGLTITEYHPHSLPVGYIAPSFDAMVSYGSADLKAVNCTPYPIIIRTSVEDFKLTVTVKGAPKEEKYVRKSEVVSVVKPEAPEVIIDVDFNYPELKKGEKKFIAYPKDGLKSKGEVVKILKSGKEVTVFSRKDFYRPIRGKIIEGISEIEPRETEGELSVSKINFI